MFCKNCGTKIDDGASFCPGCGTPVEKNAQNNSGTQQNQNAGFYAPNPGNTNASGSYQTNPGDNANKGNRSFQPAAPATGVKNRSLVLCIVLSIVTCGIYGLVWMYTLTEDIKNLTGNTSAPGGGLVILLSIITCGIYTLVWAYKQGEAVDNLKRSRGGDGEYSGLIFLILSLLGLGIVAYALMQNEINDYVGEA